MGLAGSISSSPTSCLCAVKTITLSFIQSSLRICVESEIGLLSNLNTQWASARSSYAARTFLTECFPLTLNLVDGTSAKSSPNFKQYGHFFPSIHPSIVWSAGIKRNRQQPKVTYQKKFAGVISSNLSCCSTATANVPSPGTMVRGCCFAIEWIFL